MTSVSVKTIAVPPGNFLDVSPATFSTYVWPTPKPPSQAEKKPSDQPQPSDPDVADDLFDFEFRLEDPVNILAADELFFEGKLMPLKVSSNRSELTSKTYSPTCGSPEKAKCCRRTEISSTDPNQFSPKAPRCSSKWKELLGMKKLYHNSNNKQEIDAKRSFINAKSLKHFLHRSSKSSDNQPLLKDSDYSESISILSRLSLSSSSSSGHEHDDIPRLSLDSEKPNPNLSIKSTKQINQTTHPPRMRTVKTKSSTAVSTGVSMDSPRMNASGKIVFQSLERSSSSPSSFHGGPRHKHRGVERSYSANVRISQVLNVPVCSMIGSAKSGGVFGFGQLFAGAQKSSSNSSRNRTDNRS